MTPLNHRVTSSHSIGRRRLEDAPPALGTPCHSLAPADRMVTSTRGCHLPPHPGPLASCGQGPRRLFLHHHAHEATGRFNAEPLPARLLGGAALLDPQGYARGERGVQLPLLTEGFWEHEESRSARPVLRGPGSAHRGTGYSAIDRTNRRSTCPRAQAWPRVDSKPSPLPHPHTWAACSSQRPLRGE